MTAIPHPYRFPELQLLLLKNGALLVVNEKEGDEKPTPRLVK